MNNKLRPYMDYKAIELPWLSLIPAHWGIQRNKTIMSQLKIVVGSKHNEYKLLSLILFWVFLPASLAIKTRFTFWARMSFSVNSSPVTNLPARIAKPNKLSAFSLLIGKQLFSGFLVSNIIK